MPRRSPHPEKFGRYDILLELGRGGMAELYLGRRSGVGGFEKLVAIKRILPHLAEDPQFRELFLNEARIAAQLSHPNVCQVHELDEADGELFLAMEYLEGVSWDALIAAAPRGEIAMRLATAIIVQASEGLHYAHTLRDATGQPTPIVHRDVSPQNLFITVDGACKVLDFGIAKMAKEGPKTRTGVLKGKLPYMAPEQIKGEPVDGRTDLFALGVCLWEALTGERLYDRDTDFLIWKAISEEPVPSVNAKAMRYPAALDGVIGRALAKDKAGRYATVREFAEDLSRVVFPMSDAEIAGLVRSLCADRISRRQRDVAAVVSESRAASLELRAMSGADASLFGASADPGATDAGSTTNLRGPIGNDAAATVHDSPAAKAANKTEVDEPSATVSIAMRGDSLVMPRPQRRWPIALAALAALSIIVVVVMMITREGSDETPAKPVEPDLTTVPSSDEGIDSVADQMDEAAQAMKKAGIDSIDFGSGSISVETGKMKIELGRGAGGTGMKIEKKLPYGGAAKAGSGRGVGHGSGSGIGSGSGSANTTRPTVETPTIEPAKPESPPPATLPGTLSIDSDPYATIFVDGNPAGDTPLVTKIPVGHHVIKAMLKDGRNKSVEVDVASGGAINLGKLTWN